MIARCSSQQSGRNDQSASRLFFKILPISALFALFSFATVAQAQLVPQIQSINGICGGDLQGYGQCSAGEISISEVIDLEFAGNVTECVNGQPLTITSATVNYSINTQERSDLILWLADQEGVDPRNAAGVGESCSAYSLPGPFGTPPDVNNPFGDVDGDQCGDLAISVASAARTFTNITFNCQDNDDDGKADAQVLLTWDVANNNEICGTGAGQFPTSGPPSKCDYQLLNTTVDLVFAPQLTLIKTVVNNSGGSALPTAWTLSATGPDSISGITGTPDVTAVEVTEGAYTLGETGPAGYTGTWQCTGGGTLLNGVVTLSNANPAQQTTCTLTNDDQPGTLTLVKNLITDNGSTSTLADWTLTATGPVTVTGLANSPSIVNQVVPAGTYALTENGPSGFFRSQWSCVGGTQNGGNITIGLGQNVTCTITNDDLAPTLVLVKNVQNNFNGNAVADDWTLTADGTTDYSGNTSYWAPGIEVAADTYTLSESNVDGYQSTGQWQCTGTGTQNGNQITVAVGQVAVCTIVNTDIRPGLTLVKDVTNDNGGNDAANTFDLTLTGADGTHGGGVDYQTGNMPPVLANTPYTVSEVPNTGYTLTGIVCLDDDTAQDVGTTFSLNEGQNVTCTFANDDQAPALTLVKNVVNDDGGTEGSGSFTLHVAGAANCGGQDGSANYIDNGGGVAVTPVSSNCTYTISEDPVDGYNRTGTVCVLTGTATTVPYPVTLQEGQDVTCTVTNDDIAPTGSITVIKDVINDQGGTADAADFPLQVTANAPGCGVDGSDQTSPYVVDTPVDGCVYTVTETLLDGYTQDSIICTLQGGEPMGQGQGGPPPGSFVFNNGDTWNCVVTNNDTGAQLTLVKTLTLDSGGDALVTDWMLNASGGPTPITGMSGTPAVTNATVSAGTYTLSETDGPAGYTPSDWSCPGGALTGNSLVLVNGDDVTCTIDNDDQPATLTLVKSLVQNNGGDEVADDWTLTASGTLVYQGNTTTWTGGLPVDADTYTLSEDGPDGYTAGAWQCTGVAAQGDQLTLGLGQSAVCTIINDDIAPSLTLVKDVTNDDGGQAIPDSFTLTLFGDDGTHNPALEYNTGSMPAVQANVLYTVDELPLDGYTLDSIVCTDAAGGVVGADGSLTLSLDQEVTCTVFNDDDAPTLLLNKVVTNDDTGDLDPAEFDLTLTGADGTHVAGVNYVDGDMPVIDASVSYEITETPPAGYELVSIECVDTDTQQDLPNPFSPTSGQNISCTVTNDDIAPTLVLNKVVTNDDSGELLAEDFDLTLTGADGTHDAGVDYVDGNMPVIVAGISYDVTETPPTGYELVSIECMDTDTQQDVATPFTPVLGQNVSCTVTNDDQAPTLVLIKNVINDDSGGLTPADFDLTLTGEDTVHDNGVNYVSGDMPVIEIGTSYEVSEVAPNGYELVDIVCTDTDTQQAVSNPFTPTLGQNISCTVTNDDDPAEAYFRVNKFFPDGNPQEVRVMLSCNNGQPTEQFFDISEGSNVNFVMTLFSPGDMDCTVTEITDLAGYSSKFEAGIIDGEAGDVYETEDPNTCHYEDVVGGQFYCDITNNVEPVDVTVHKIWEVNQYSGNVVPNDTTVVIWCNAEIENGYYDSNVGYWYMPFDIVGDSTSIASVLPEYPSSICWATENLLYSEIEVDNECGDSAGSAQLTISAGNGDECTITNTVFFEGIPTLNQYGIAILSLLMLGLGVVGMRRFI